MNDEVLIALVRQHPVLFDTCHEKYMDVSLKQKIWHSIARALECDVPTVKTRWNNIRDNYRKSWRKSEFGSKKIKTYKYATLLDFLNRFFEKKDRGSLDQQEGSPIEFKEERFSDEQEEADEIEVSNERSLHPECTLGVTVDVVDTDQDHSRAGQHKSRLRKRRLLQRRDPPTKRVPNLDTTSATVLKFLIDKSERSSEPASNPVDAFLAGVSPSLRSLDPYEWHAAKAEIFAVVQKYELKMMMRQQVQEVTHTARDSSNNSPTPSGVRQTEVPLSQMQQSSDSLTTSTAQENSSYGHDYPQSSYYQEYS